MSKIQAAIESATELKATANQPRQEYLSALALAVSELGDNEYEDLSDDAKDWSNTALDAFNAKKPLPDMPDYLPPTAKRGSANAGELAAAPRRSAAAKKDAASPVVVGATAIVTTARDRKVQGVIVEVTEELIVLDVEGKDKEFDRDELKNIEILHGDAKGSDAPDAPDVKVGDQVVIINKRDREFTGEVVELADDFVVIDVDGKEKEFDMGEVKSMLLAAAAVGDAQAGAPVQASRRGSAKVEDARAAPAGKRSTNEGVSIGTRIKELIADDLDASEADIAKVLKKEGVEFKENTLKLNFVDAHKFITILKQKKLLK